jgi:hypothetical protein
MFPPLAAGKEQAMRALSTRYRVTLLALATVLATAAAPSCPSAAVEAAPVSGPEQAKGSGGVGTPSGRPRDASAAPRHGPPQELNSTLAIFRILKQIQRFSGSALEALNPCFATVFFCKWPKSS